MALNIQDFLEDKSRYYTTYRKKKPNGKYRVITAPNDDLKEAQKKIAKWLEPFAETSYHLSVQGFRTNHSVVTNAAVHTDKKTIINIDIENFFPSVNSDWINKFLDMFQGQPYSIDDMYHIVTLYNKLPQGSPASPIIANCYLAMTDFDNKLDILCKEYKFDYTRYADDLTLSTNEDYTRGWLKRTFIPEVYKLLEEIGLHASKDKTKIRSQSQRQMVTGVLVNGEDPRVTRKYTNHLRAVLHNHLRDNVPLSEEILGTLSFIRSVNEEQYNKLMKAYKKEE